MIPTAEILELQHQIESMFPTVQDERPLYFLDASAPGVERRIASARVAEPDATIFVLGGVDRAPVLKRLLHAGADGVFDPSRDEEREALLRGAAVHVARSERSRGGVIGACQALRSLILEWNRRMVLVERREAAA